MKKSHTASLVLASLLLSVSGAVYAQTGGLTRTMVNMDRNTFLSMFSWNELNSEWVLKSGMMPPAGVKSREEVLAMREEFLSMNTWNELNSQWMPVKDGPRKMSSLSREQLERETYMFNMTHRFDETSAKWISKMLAKK
jgi:hypothetical protein